MGALARALPPEPGGTRENGADDRGEKEPPGRFLAYVREAKVFRPQDLSPALLQAYLLYRRETPNARGKKDRAHTVNTHVMVVRSFIGFLAREGLVARELPEAISYVKTQKHLPKDVPSHDEVQKMLNAIDITRPIGFRDRAVFELLYSTGMRRQELQDLRVEDVDVAGGYVRIERGKGGKGRVVPLGKVAGEWVKNYTLVIRPGFLRGKPDPGWLFLTKSGEKLDGEAVRQAVVKAAKAAGIQKKVSPHGLRRACATEMIRRRANPHHVKELLGHEDYRSLNAYTKLAIQDLKDAHQKFHPREQKEGEGDDEGMAGTAVRQ